MVTKPTRVDLFAKQAYFILPNQCQTKHHFYSHKVKSGTNVRGRKTVSLSFAFHMMFVFSVFVMFCGVFTFKLFQDKALPIPCEMKMSSH